MDLWGIELLSPRGLIGKGGLVAIGLLILAAGALAWWSDKRTAGQVPAPITAAALTFGGPFALVDHTGRNVTEQDYLGYFTLVFFGFTLCPDVCPTTLQNVASVLQILGDDSASIRPLFITVDPERDTPATMASYVSLFDPRIIGLTGTKDQIARVARVYRIHYRKADDKNATYLMEHTAVTFLMGPDGKYLAHIPPDMPPKRAVETIRQHMTNRRPSAGQKS